MPKFTKGAAVFDDAGKLVRSLDGVAFELRPLTNLVRIQAARNVKRLDSADEVELARASFVSLDGAPLTDQDFAGMNVQAMSDVNKALGEVNGDGPLSHGSGSSSPSG